MTNFAEELKKNGVVVFTCKGVSMMPLLRQDRDVLVIRAQTDGFRKNDVVLFRRTDGRYILHRITKVREQDYFIIGDNCLTGENVRPEQILGILTEIKRDGKTVSVTDAAYRRYVRTVPFRRWYQQWRHRAYVVWKKIRRK